MIKRILVFGLLLGGLTCLVCGFWIPLKAALAQQLLLHAWSKSLESDDPVKPWPWADSWPVGRLYQQRLGVDLIVLEGESGEVLAFGPGHLTGSGALGGSGHSILAGHRDTSFSFLRKLQEGDILQVEGAKGTASYSVIAKDIASAGSLYLDGEVEGFLSLITCYPFERIVPGGDLRYIVTAERVAKGMKKKK